MRSSAPTPSSSADSRTTSKAEGGVPLGWYDVLLTLERAPGRRLRMQDLGDAVVLSRSRVSRIVDDLERQGFVTREPCDADRRVVYASITRPGRVALRHAIPAHLRAIETHFSSYLTDDEIVTIHRALGRVAAANGGTAPNTASPARCSARCATSAARARSRSRCRSSSTRAPRRRRAACSTRAPTPRDRPRHLPRTPPGGRPTDRSRCR